MRGEIEPLARGPDRRTAKRRKDAQMQVAGDTRLPGLGAKPRKGRNR